MKRVKKKEAGRAAAARPRRISRLMLFLDVLVVLLVVGWLLIPPDGAPILAYHQVGAPAAADAADDVYNVDAAAFEEQMAYLKDHGYQAVSLAEFLAARRHPGALPAKPVVITFDDGYRDNYTTALPILEKYRMKATVFVITSFVGEPGYLTWGELRDMQARGMEIGSHTMRHAALGELSPAARRGELSGSKKGLEEHLKTPVQFLAYPYGSFNAAVAGDVRAAGYLGACTGEPGLNDDKTDAYELRRVNMPKPKYGLLEFKLRLLRAELYHKFRLE